MYLWSFRLKFASFFSETFLKLKIIYRFYVIYFFEISKFIMCHVHNTLVSTASYTSLTYSLSYVISSRPLVYPTPVRVLRPVQFAHHSLETAGIHDVTGGWQCP